MTEPLPSRRRTPPPSPPRRAVAARWLLRLLLAAAIFAAGIALGEALHDNPQPGHTQTLLRTLKPTATSP